MSSRMAGGFTDTTTGTFYNSGTIGASYVTGGIAGMIINGKLVSRGTIAGSANGADSGYIQVNGTADIDSSSPRGTAGQYIQGACFKRYAERQPCERQQRNGRSNQRDAERIRYGGYRK